MSHSKMSSNLKMWTSFWHGPLRSCVLRDSSFCLCYQTLAAMRKKCSNGSKCLEPSPFLFIFPNQGSHGNDSSRPTIVATQRPPLPSVWNTLQFTSDVSKHCWERERNVRDLGGHVVKERGNVCDLVLLQAKSN